MAEMRQRGENPKGERGFSHVLKAPQGAPLPGQGPGQTFKSQGPGGMAECPRRGTGVNTGAPLATRE